MDSGVIEGGLNVTLTIRLLMHGKVSVLVKKLVRYFSTMLPYCLLFTLYTSDVKQGTSCCQDCLTIEFASVLSDRKLEG